MEEGEGEERALSWVNDTVERYWAKNGKWYVGSITKEQMVDVGRGRRRQRQLLIHFDNEKTKRNDAWLPARSKELRLHTEYLESFANLDGHLEDDQWEVERILDARGRRKTKEYLVCWRATRRRTTTGGLRP